MVKPKVSIIMSNYNSEEFVGQTISSVLAQTYTNFEFIIIDDASTDNARNVMDSFGDERIKRYYLSNNEHMCYCFNLAIEKSSGKYLARIDNDDTWEPKKLEKQIQYMENHTECGAIFTWAKIINEKDEVLTAEECERVTWFKTENMEQDEWIRYFYFNGSCLCHPSAVIRRDVLDVIGVYNYSLIQIQDYDLWVRIVKKYPIYVIKEELTNYRLFMSGKNVSAPSKTTITRSNFEFTHVLSHYFDDVSDEMLIKAFGNDFMRKDVTTHEDLECERMFLLLKPVFCGNLPRLGGMEKMIQLLQDDVTRKVLREKYGVTQKNFYEMSALPLFYESTEQLKYSNRELIKKVEKYILSKWPAAYRFVKKCMEKM